MIFARLQFHGCSLQASPRNGNMRFSSDFAFLNLRCSASIGCKHNAEVLMQQNSMLFHSSYHQCALLASVSCASRARYESRNMKSINKHSAASFQAIRLIGCARSMPRHSLFAPISEETYAKLLLFQYGENRSNESLAWWEAAKRDCQLPMLFSGPSFGCLHKKPFSVTNQSYRYRYSGAEWDGGTLPAGPLPGRHEEESQFPTT